MLDGFEPRTFWSPTKGGRPARAPSNRLRNLAWLRFLLSSLDDLYKWAGADASEKHNRGDYLDGEQPVVIVPDGWLRRPADAALLKQRVVAMTDALSSKELSRSPALLDELFGPLFGGAEGSGGRYFSDRILRGLASPDTARLHRIDDLVPGSHACFDDEPMGVDPWFYDALDFSNVWFAKLFLWRAMDPMLEDPGWDDLVAARDTGTVELKPEVMESRHGNYEVSQSDIETFETMIENAAAVSAFPGLLTAPAGEINDGIECVLDGAASGIAAVSGIDRASVALSDAVASRPPVAQWAMLSNAIAARRVSSMLGVSGELTTWWLAGVQRALTSDFRIIEANAFCRMPRGRSPIDDVVERLIAGAL
jgi:hypothetical protein